jgi:Protein of unknown function (DUF2510)
VSQEDLFGAPAGWYPDPLGLPQLRWWNNHAWTEQTSAARQPMVMQDTKFAWADDDLPTRREERERERTLDDSETIDTARPTAETLRELNPPTAFTTTVDEEVAPSTAAPTVAAPTVEEAPQRVESLYEPDPIVEPFVTIATGFTQQSAQQETAPAHDESLDALFGTRETQPPRSTAPAASPLPEPAPAPAAPVQVRSALVSTGPAWVIAMIPLFQLVSSLLCLNFGLGGLTGLFLGILLVPYALVVGLAFADYKLLKAGGHDQPAHWAWAFLTAPVYLLMRARAVISQSGRGIGPVLVWFALAFLHIASVVAIPGLIISVAPGVFVPQIEQSIERDAKLISGTDLTVTCPATPPVLIGEQVVCTSVNAAGNGADITVALARSNGWISWQVIDWGVFTVTK